MDAYHTLIFGDSGGGKTTLAREMHARFDGLSIVVTPKDGADGFEQTGAREIVDDAETARDRAREYVNRTGWPAQVVVDEAGNYLPEGATKEDNVVFKGLTEDRDHPVKWVLCEQDVMELEYSPLKSCRWMALAGIPHPLHLGFARSFKLPEDETPTEKYEYVVFEKVGRFQWGVANRASTDPAYS